MLKRFSMVCAVACLALAGCGSSGDSHGGSAGAATSTGEGGDGGEGGSSGAPSVILGNASIRGVVLDVSDSPIVGAHVRAAGQDVLTDADGVFDVTRVNAATARVLEVDATSLTNELGLHYGIAREPLALSDEDQLTLDTPIRLTPLNAPTSLGLAADPDPNDPQSVITTQDVTLFPSGADGLALNIPSGTTLTWPAGSEVGSISVTRLQLGRLPFAIAGGAGLALQIEPEGITFQAPDGTDGNPAPIPSLVFPNELGLDDGTALTLNSVSKTTGELQQSGSMTVSSDSGSPAFTMSSAASGVQALALPDDSKRPILGCTGECVVQCARRPYAGRVLDQTKQPVKNITVRLYEGWLNALHGVVLATTTTDNSGAYHFPAQYLCRWQVEAESDLGEIAEADGNVKADATSQVPDLQLTAYSAPTNIEVRVTDPAGEPWQGRTILAIPPGFPSAAFASAVTDKDGIARLAGVRTPLEPLPAGKTSSQLAIQEQDTGCLIPLALDPLPPPNGKPQPPAVDKSGLPVWKADRTVQLLPISNVAKTAPLVKEYAPLTIGQEILGLQNKDGLDPKQFQTTLPIEVTGPGISSRAQIALNDEQPKKTALERGTWAPRLQCGTRGLTATFDVLRTRFSATDDTTFHVINPNGASSETDRISLLEPDQEIVLSSLSQAAFLTGQAPIRVTAGYTAAQTIRGNSLVLSNGEDICAAGHTTSNSQGLQRAYFDLPTITAAETGSLRLFLAPNGCDGHVWDATRISSSLPYTVTTAKPVITGVSPHFINASMRRDGFDMTVTGSGLTSTDDLPLGVAVGDGPFNPYLYVLHTDDTLPAQHNSFWVDLSGKTTMTSFDTLVIHVAAGQIPDFIAARNPFGAEQLRLAAVAPGGGAATTNLIFEADLLCKTDTCSVNGTCTDQITESLISKTMDVSREDSVSCVCKNGYFGNGLQCTKVNGCLINDDCGAPHSHCQADADGGPQCVCDNGYAGDGMTCANTCLTNNGGCYSIATCSIPKNTVICTCPAGQFNNGTACAPDPCLTNNGGCTDTQISTPTAQGPTCGCPTGYIANGNNCYVNQCLTNNGGCKTNFTCGIYSEGMVGCSCLSPYVYDQTFTNCVMP